MMRTAPETLSLRSSSSRWLVLPGVWLIYFCFGIIIASMAPLVAPITQDLGISNTTMGAILGAWPLTYIFAAIPCGILLDRIGARRMLFCAALIMAISAAARGFATTPGQLLAAVALFGLGGPLISVGAPKIIAGLFTGPDRATAMGIYVTGPYLGGLVTLALTNSLVMPLVGDEWRNAMFVFAAFTALSGIVWLMLSSGLGASLGQAEGGKKFDLRAFSSLVELRAVRLILAMSIGIFFINHALNNWLPEILVDRGLGVVEAGYWASIPALVGIVGALIVPRLAVPSRRLEVMGALFVATLVASILLQGSPGVGLFLGLILQGLARGSMMTIAILILMETPSVPSERLGLAGGLFFTTAEIGGVLGPLSFGILSDIDGGFTLPLVSLTVVSTLLLGILLALRAAPAS